jgi:hypothetical protein
MLGLDTWTLIGILLLAGVILTLVGGAFIEENPTKQRDAVQRAADRAARKQARQRRKP